MVDKSIYSKTARGFREVVNKTKDVSRELRRVLESVDGKSDFQTLLKALDGYSEQALQQALSELIRKGYLRDPEEYRVPSVRPGAIPRPPPLVSHADNEFDFTAMADSPPLLAASATDPAEAQARLKAQQEAEALARRLAAETQARNKAEAQSRQAAEAKARQKAEVLARRMAEEDRVQKEAETRRRQEAEVKARQEAEVLVRRKAEEERVQQEAEAQVRREAEIKAQREAEAEALRRAEEAQAAELIAKQAKEKIRLDAQREMEARLKREAEARAKKDAEEVAQRQAEQEQARKKAEALIRQEVETKAREAAEALAQRKAEEERLQHEAEVQAAAEVAEQQRREIWAKSRLEAKILAQRKADEEQARRDAEALIQKEDEAKAQQARDALAQRRAEEERAKQEAEVQIRREIEAKAQQERDALVQRKIEEKRAKKAAVAQKKAQTKIRRETAAKEKAEAKARAKREVQELADKKAYVDEIDKGFAVAASLSDRQNRRQYGATWKTGISSMLASMRHALAGQSRESKKTRRQLVRAVIFALFVGVIVLHVISFDERLSMLEKTATAQFKKPVKAQALRFWLLPTPHWRLQNVIIGDQGQIRVSLVKVETSIGALFSSQNAMASIDAESATLNAEGVEWLLEGKTQGNNLGFSRINVKGVQVSSSFGALPNFDAHATLDANGNWQQIGLRTPGQKFNAELNATGNGTRVTLSAAAYTAPLSLESVNASGPEKLILKNFSAVGILASKEFSVSEFSGEIHGGYVSGKARLNWSSGWTLNGEARAKLFDTAAMFPALSEGGLLSGSGTFAMQAADPVSLLTSARAEGSFLVERGVLHGIDLGQALRGLGSGGRTPYATLDGKFAYSRGKTQLRNVKMIDGIMTTTGRADIDADKAISSRFFVELKSNFIHETRAVSMTGTLDAPQFSR